MICQYSNTIAISCGINAALVAGYLWDEQKTKGNIIQGRIWIRCSIRTLRNVFPFMGEDAISNALRRLREHGYILCLENNKSKFDRTKSYAFTPNGITLMLNIKSN